MPAFCVQKGDFMKKTENIICDTVSFDETTEELIIIDQTLLPGNVKLLRLSDEKSIYQAIYELKVRGAPAIGVAAAIGIYAVCKRFPKTNYADFASRFSKVKQYLASSRPTAVNLTWALDRMEKIVTDNVGIDTTKLLLLLRNEAMAIRDQDIAVCRAIGENGFSLLNDTTSILTHCNAGRLAAVRYGTALAPVYIAQERGKEIKVFSDETRPLLQGARLTAWELASAGVDVTVICDNMVSSVMKKGLIQAVFVGCDRVAANGDTANKIGTSGVAIMARHYGIPFYVCAPLSTIDMTCPNAEHINIEQRSGLEVTDMWYQKRMSPKNVSVYNPAFDVTNACLITAFITERGVIYPDYKQAFEKLFDKV